MGHDFSSPQGALAFVDEHGVVLESGRGPVPSLVEAIAGESIRGSWWGHPKGQAIFRATRAVRDSAEVLVCRLVEGKITYVHRRLWPALVRLADQIGPGRLDALREEHTPSGAHKLVTRAFSTWVTADLRSAAKRLSQTEARSQVGEWLAPRASGKSSTEAKRGRR